MTSVVRVSAHLGEDKEVKIIKTDGGNVVEEIVLQDGEESEVYVHDDLAVMVREVEKEK